jgi:hypothetical protein
MRYFAYNDTGENGEPIVSVLSEKQILNKYWKHWVRAVEEQRRLTPSEASRLNTDDCIEDWATIHWAWPCDEKGRALEPGL